MMDTADTWLLVGQVKSHQAAPPGEWTHNTSATCLFCHPQDMHWPFTGSGKLNSEMQRDARLTLVALWQKVTLQQAGAKKCKTARPACFSA